MKNFTILLSVCLIIVNNGQAQENLKESNEDTLSVVEHLDELTLLWDEKSIELKTYQGLRKFCRSSAYRNSIIEMLESMHHYDSLLYDMAIEASKKKHTHMKHLIHELESFERHYGVKQFLKHLKEECTAQSDLERHKKDYKKDNGDESYDSKVYVVELELKKYVKHLTHRIDRLNRHVHHLMKK